MSRATPDDQLKFLLSCVKYSNNGKIDFIEVAKECGIVSKGAAYATTLAISALRNADQHRLRAKRYERLMKANGIHPNGGPSTTSPTTPVAATKTVSNGVIPRATAAKKRKLEVTISHPVKHDEQDDELLQPKLEPLLHPTRSIVRTEPLPNASMPFSAANFALSSNLTAIMDHTLQQQQLECTNSVFEEFCIPEMFAQHNFEEETAKSEQELQHLPSTLQSPRYMPLPLPVMVERLKQSPNPNGRRESGKGPLESIVIAD